MDQRAGVKGQGNKKEGKQKHVYLKRTLTYILILQIGGTFVGVAASTSGSIWVVFILLLYLVPVFLMAKCISVNYNYSVEDNITSSNQNKVVNLE